jgi:hypothetical protein
MGPILARWNHFLEHRFPLRPGSSSTKAGAAAGSHVVDNVQKAVQGGQSNLGNVSITALAKRVGMDQAVMAPLGVRIQY